MATIMKILKSHILVMAEIPVVWLEQPYVSSHAYVFKDMCTCICICLLTTLCICVCSKKTEGPDRVWMKYGSNLARCPPSPPSPNPHWPAPLTLSLGHLVRRRRGFELGRGVRGEVYTGRVRDRLHNQPGTLLSNYYTMVEEGEMESGGWGGWERGTCVLIHLCGCVRA